MKKMIVLSLIALFAGSAAMAQSRGVDFRADKSFSAILEEAGRENKMIFVDVYAVWCGPCKVMSETIFPQAESGNYFNSQFVNWKVDAEKGEGVGIARRYAVRAYPTFLILDKEGKELGRVVGSARTAASFIERVKDELAKIR